MLNFSYTSDNNKFLSIKEIKDFIKNKIIDDAESALSIKA